MSNINELIKTLKPKAQRGSKPRCHIITHGDRKTVASRLTDMIAPWGEVSSNDQWMPDGFRVLTEAQLSMCPQLLDEASAANIRSWWMAVGNGITPSWDIASTCTIDGKKGILLVEAKAHEAELSHSCRKKYLRKDASKNSVSNHLKIGQCIEQARRGLNIDTGLQWNLSRDCCYQMSNRFAFAWKLTQLGFPTILVYLGFINAHEMADRSKPYLDQGKWDNHVRRLSARIAPGEMWNSPYIVNSHRFISLIRCAETPLIC